MSLFLRHAGEGLHPRQAARASGLTVLRRTPRIWPLVDPGLRRDDGRVSSGKRERTAMIAPSCRRRPASTAGLHPRQAARACGLTVLRRTPRIWPLVDPGLRRDDGRVSSDKPERSAMIAPSCRRRPASTAGGRLNLWASAAGSRVPAAPAPGKWRVLASARWARPVPEPENSLRSHASHPRTPQAIRGLAFVGSNKLCERAS